MTCTLGCCGTSESQIIEDQPPLSQLEVEDGDCCDKDGPTDDGSSESIQMEDDCCKQEEKGSVCNKNILAPPLTKEVEKRDGNETHNSKGSDACCAPKRSESDDDKKLTPNSSDDCCKVQMSETDDDTDCCDEDRSQIEDPTTPDCCKGKSTPCCDVSCIERIALRECNTEEEMAKTEPTLKFDLSSKDCHGQTNGKPCKNHTRSAFERYGQGLRTLGCICRTLLARGQPSCCLTRDRANPKRQRHAKTTDCCSRNSSSSLSNGSNCLGGANSGKECCSKVQDVGVTRKTACGSKCCTVNTTSCGPKFKPTSDLGCCSKCEAAGTGCGSKFKAAGTSECCSKRKAASTTNCDSKFKTANNLDCCSKVDSIADSCVECCAEKSTDFIEKAKETSSITNHAIDIEKGLLGREHVILSVSGMTCTGCETKLNRSLTGVEAVKNLKTSLILSRAEFDLDISAKSLTEVIKHLERTTEFKFERVMNQGSGVDIMVPGDAEDFIQQTWPDGVKQITAIDKNSVHVSFDTEIIRARDLVEKGWTVPMKLSPLRTDPTLEAGNKHVRHTGLMTLLSAFLTIPVLVMAWAPLPERDLAYGSASLGLATIVQFVVAGPFYPKALKSLIFSGMIEMDLLVVLSTSAAYIFSVVSFGYLVAGHPLTTGEFFETSTLLVTLIMVGRYVSALARQKAVESISVRSLQPSTALIIEEDGNEREIDTRLLQYGDKFKVAPDSKIPTDGIVLSGSSEIDESLITGESRPVEKFSKSKVIAGSINGSGTLVVQLTQLPDDNTISNIAKLVDKAKLSKPKIQDLADRVATFFVPTIIILTVIAFVIWTTIGVMVRKQSGSEATIQSITYAITLLIVSCPCGIGLAVPMVIVIASGVAAERGIIFKTADSIELAHKATCVVFDKTGTLTQGRLKVVGEEYPDGDSDLAKSMLLGLIKDIKHPVSAAVTALLKANGVIASTVAEVKILTGKGVQGTISGKVLRAGNSRWLNLGSDPFVQSAISNGYTAFCFTIDGMVVANFALEDSLSQDAVDTVERLQKNGIKVHVVSGDDDGAVRSVASQLGIPNSQVLSRCTPAEKQAYVQGLLSTANSTTIKSGRKSKQQVVVFCGDGTNDAVALAQATIGVHMNGGTDVAKSAADVVLMRPGVGGVLTMISVSKKAMNRVLFNFGWSFVYNLFAILFGAGAFVTVRIPPEYAGLGELVSVLPVIAAAMLLRWSKF